MTKTAPLTAVSPCNDLRASKAMAACLAWQKLCENKAPQRPLVTRSPTRG